MWTFANDIWAKLFPEYININDSYKNVDGKGIVERVLQVCGDELDENTIVFINEFFNNLQPLLANNTLLPHLAYTMGSPPFKDLDEDQFRYLIQRAATIYKWKGTTNSYLALFLLLGLYVTLVVDWPEDILYDEETLYDDGALYDTYCINCIPYWLYFSKVSDDPTADPPEYTELTEEEYAAVLSLVEGIKCWIEPINADFMGLVRTYFLKESITIDLSKEHIELTVMDYTLYDDGLIYDDSEDYDDVLLTTTIIDIG